MRLTPIIVTSEVGITPKSRVLVNMDKFVDAVEDNSGLINMWFEGPFNLTVDKSDFRDVLLKSGVCQRDIEEYMPGVLRQSVDSDFHLPGGRWEKHIS